MSRDKPSWNIPSFEDIEKQKAQQSKQPLSFFKAKRTLAESSLEDPKTQAPSPQPQQQRPPASTPSRTQPSHTNIRRSTANSILVNPTQQKNPILKHVHNVPWEPSDAIKMDYVVGQTTGVIYLSLRYHRLYPSYIYDRLNAVKNLYVCRILLVYVDVENYHDAIREINRIAILSDFTLMLAWSPEEAGRYLETYKALENRAPDLIKERVEDEYLAKITDCLTQIRSVNKTDVLTLLSTFGSLKQISEATTDQLAMCPGFGEQKVKRIQQVWKQPFLANSKKQKRK
ncbi:restriction endonuclease type II-like protein [Gilbertella persicaria]|uniref:restriction endonuclease type II-like protein n=1 Tax=Gilbertella persicaria TaxID=101096 RepID=UPI002220C80F|nr:restriction endonuclease type II-like protein [Gilbertella persicaria]KAI8066216.1 restriction endonuclease type II-like protein [Gilbertella persicaria]